jgi:hypothetical protein
VLNPFELTRLKLFLHGRQHKEGETVIDGIRVIAVYGMKLVELPLMQCEQLFTFF